MPPPFISADILLGQLLLGLINGAFYATLSLGLSIIFGILNVVNFAHGAQYMMGAFAAWALLAYLGVGFWWSLLLVPLIVGAIGMLFERVLISRIYHRDPLYGFLLTLGFALVVQGLLREKYGVSGLRYAVPPALAGAKDLGFMFLPYYRAFAVLVSIATCLAAWFAIEKTKLGSYLRAAAENATLSEALGINVPVLLTVTYGIGVALAAFAGVLAAPIYSVSPLMGENMLIIVFAVVVIGGLGSIVGSIVAGVSLGVIEGLTKVFYPQASSTVIFVAMIVVLMLRSDGLFGRRA